MSTRIYFFIILISVACLITATSVVGVRRYNTNHFSCNGIYSASYNNIMLHANARITFFGGEGTVVLRGVLENKSKKISNLVLSTMFSFEKMNDSFVLTATKNTVEMNQEKEMLKNILPEFYYKKGIDVIYDIFPQGNDYLFVRGGIPVFMCRR